jgi:hypothetical protein
MTMKWDAIQQGAKTKGVLVYAIDQAQTAPLTQPGPWGSAYDGDCIGLSANWVALAYQGKDFSFSAQVCDDPPWQATMAQTLSDDSGASTFTGRWKAAVTPFACTADGLAAERKGAPSAAFLCQVVFRAYGCYGITLERPSGAHAVVMRNGRDGRLHLFDPNYFHVAIRKPCDFQDFVGWWLAQTGYDKRYTVASYVIGIRPPINHTHP